MSKKEKATFGLLVKYTYFTFVYLVGVMIVIKSTDYLYPNFNSGFLIGKELIFNKWYKYILYTHILTAPIALFSGILQFLLHPKEKFHRASGYLYIITAILGGISGFFMSLQSIGGIGSSISFILLSTLWLYFTLKAFILIRKGEIQGHRRYMTRSFILVNSAILLRLFLFVSNNYIDIHPDIAYIYISWLSWLPWLIFYECIILLKRKKISVL